MEANRQRKFQEISAAHIVAVMTGQKCWSPLVFERGRRHGDNFKSADFMVFDFDSGKWDLAKTKAWCEEKGLAYVIAPTKSHQIPKRTGTNPRTKEPVIAPPCDRFRLVLFAKTTCTNRDQYVGHMTAMMKILPVDRNCKDAARFFYPGPHGVWARNLEGDRLGWIKEAVIDKANEADKLETLRAVQLYRSRGVFPQRVRDLIAKGSPFGTRHKSLYFIGRIACEVGMSRDEIKRMIFLGSPLAEVGEVDVHRCIDNAFNKG